MKHIVAVCFAALLCSTAGAQSVCLPAPRLLTVVPMGGQVGTTVEVTITGEHLEDTEELSFSHPGLSATHKLDDKGQPVPNQYVVQIAADCPVGVHDARVMSRLGISSARAFSVGTLSEVTRTQANTTLETAMALEVDSICNASMTNRSVDYYTFQAQQGQRIVIDCAASGIDSKLTPVLIVADATGADLQVERRGGAIDFTAPETATYVVKVHDLTFSGSTSHFYRLALQAAQPEQVVPRLLATRQVSSFSWPPVGLSDEAALAEAEPNNSAKDAMQITLPCDISGSFYPAADVDTFEFEAKKGEVWWVEVASERLGRPTDASAIVQHIQGSGDDQVVTDVAELTDIAHPIKVSSNGYSYDGPPYHAGSPDILGKVEIKADGRHRLQLLDLFGGTRSDPRNVYRLIIRKAQPDFAVVAWALHMGLRNGDRNALSKPMALRNGYTMPIEVVTVRRDGFDGDIELQLENLPEGVTATGLKIPAGQTRGIMLVTAHEDAPRGLTRAVFTGKAIINDSEVVRPCHLASMKWPVPNAKSEIPAPRLMADVPVSVGGSESTPITIAPAQSEIITATVGEKLTIPLQQTVRCEFSGPKMSLNTYGAGFEKAAAFDVSLTADKSEAVLDLAALKVQPGDYTIAFYGSAVAKYSYHPQAVAAAEAVLEAAKVQAAALETEAKSLAENAAAATEQDQAAAKQAVQDIEARKKAAAAAVKAAEQKLAAATNAAKPKDIVDIVVSKPIQIRVEAAAETAKK